MSWDGKRNRERPRGWAKLRKTAGQRANWRCEECGIDIDLRAGRCDHIIAWADGGSDELDNLQWLCISCHNYKSRIEIRARLNRDKPVHPGLRVGGTPPPPGRRESR